MVNFLKVSDACAAVLGVLYFIRELLKIVYIIIPIGLIVMISLDFMKGVISFDDGSSKVLNYVLKRIIYTIVIFLVPSTVFSLFNVLGVSINDSSSCWKFVNETSVDTVKTLSKNQEEALERRSEKIRNEIVENLKNYQVKMNDTINVVSDTSGSSSGDIVLDWNDLSKVSNISASNLKKALESLKWGKKVSQYSSDYVSYEKKYKVNVFFLIGLEAHESGAFGSSLAVECNNFGGVKSKPICPGHGSYRQFSSKEKFIDYHAKLLGNSYLKENGKYYNGKKLSDLKKTYCGNCSDWVSSIKTFGNALYKKAK